MSEAEVLDAVHAVVCRELGREVAVDHDTHLVDDLGLDSLGLLCITVELENRFEVCLEPDGHEPLLRVGDVARVLMQLRKTQKETAACVPTP